MKYLWSPWRMSYIQDPKTEAECVFCHAQTLPDGIENQIVHRGKNAFVILNRYPYTSGHLMVLPFAHQPSLDDLPLDTRTEITELVTQSMKILRAAYGAGGFNLGANLGVAAGAGIPKHFHFHVVPRWEGDTNFMTAVGGTRVVPEALEETYHRISLAWKNVDNQT